MHKPPLYSIHDIASFVETSYTVVYNYIRYHYPELLVIDPSTKIKYRKPKMRFPKPLADKLIAEISNHRGLNHELS